jgi:ATP-dependent RNA helicase DDX46/PRP5
MEAFKKRMQAKKEEAQASAKPNAVAKPSAVAKPNAVAKPKMQLNVQKKKSKGKTAAAAGPMFGIEDTRLKLTKLDDDDDDDNDAAIRAARSAIKRENGTGEDTLVSFMDKIEATGDLVEQELTEKQEDERAKLHTISMAEIMGTAEQSETLGPTVVLSNVFDPKEASANPALVKDAENDMGSECSNAGPIELLEAQPDGRVLIKYADIPQRAASESVIACISVMHGRIYMGRTLSCTPLNAGAPQQNKADGGGDGEDASPAPPKKRAKKEEGGSDASAAGKTNGEQEQEEKVETEAERAAREQREEEDHRLFMEAFRAKHAQDEKREADAVSKLQEEVKVKEEEEKKKQKEDLGLILQNQEDDAEMAQWDDEEGGEVQKSALEMLADAQKGKELKQVDHAEVEYSTVRKKFYIESPEMKAMTVDECMQLRKEMEIKIRGKGCPKPVSTWLQCGFSTRMLQVLRKYGYEKPFDIQRQALPAIMSGRDVIGVAKTGSGKTLAFMLPMLRHILDQPPLGEGEGPIGLIMAPSRELTLQIYSEARRFGKALGMRANAVYGGAGVVEQIANMKRGSDIVVCTPGRFIDILTMNAGKLVSLARVSYLIIDEADRMFDMGFEPQIARIINNIRPDRQTLLFSATFPPAVEMLARQILTKPLEIIVGGRSVASGDIKQYVEVRDEADKFLRLLQLLGKWYEKGNVLVFVKTQADCDSLFQRIMKAGYLCTSLHGGMDQMDRDFTIDDFKKRIRTLMVATSVAGRGLDVKELVLVINYHCPNHLEDYVHRVGRTGRAGRKGTAYTFISEEEEAYSPIIVKALTQGKQTVPPQLQQMASAFEEKVKAGTERNASSGFSGKGFKFDDSEMSDAKRHESLQKKQYEIDQGITDAEELQVQSLEEGMEQSTTANGTSTAGAAEGGENSSATAADPVDPAMAAAAAAKAIAAKMAAEKNMTPIEKAQAAAKAALAKAQAAANAKLGYAPTAGMVAVGGAAVSAAPMDAMAKARAIAAAMNIQKKLGLGGGAGGAAEESSHLSEKLVINDYPQKARHKILQHQTKMDLQEEFEVSIIQRGSYIAPNRSVQPGEEKLHLLIEGNNAQQVRSHDAPSFRPPLCLCCNPIVCTPHRS